MPSQLNEPSLLKAVGIVIRQHVASVVASIQDRLEKLERALQELPVPKDGAPGVDGKSVTLEEIEPLVKRAVAALPPAKDGEPGEPGEDGRPGQPGADGKSVTVEELQPLVKQLVDESVAALPPAQDGEPGIDGKSVTIEEVIPVVREAVAQLPKPKDGDDGKSVTVQDVLPAIKEWFDALPKPKDGLPGVDGKSVTLDDMRDFMEATFAKWALDWERRAMDVNQRCLDRFEKPKNGKNGIDGLGFDDMSVAFDGRRTVTLRFERGEQVKEFPIKFATVLETGVWLHDKEYEQGDGVTCGGNYWIAIKDTSARPGENNNDWRLAVRKGRDGKSAETAPRFAGAAR